MRRHFVRLFVFAVLCAGTSYAQTRDDGDCPRVTVEGPAGISMQGEAIIFEAQVAGMPQNLIGYEWSVNQGEISEGQGTSKISVIGGEPGSNVTATVRITGVSAKCSVSASETAGVAPVIACSMPLDEFGKISWNDERARLYNLVVQIKQNPGSSGVISIYLAEGETVETERKHLARIIKHITSVFKTFDLERLIFSIEKSDDRRTVFRLVPPEVDLPACNGCTIMDGKQIQH